MISVGTKLHASDNSGARVVQCIKVFRGNSQTPAKVGDTILVSVQSVAAKHKGKAKPGQLFHAVVTASTKRIRRKDGSSLRFDKNAVVLLNSQGVPVGTRVLGVATHDLRRKGFVKVLTLAPYVL
uniref:Ribosomal protein L14 n=1 Tax=prasinophyte sp. MBIC10622 TaxID=156113 RepID=A0A650AKL0_9CHLO|nr:ribosomal protein L14 [prasinophyte sp. MBIC10622]